jgi:hypothetical protein
MNVILFTKELFAIIGMKKEQSIPRNQKKNRIYASKVGSIRTNGRNVHFACIMQAAQPDIKKSRFVRHRESFCVYDKIKMLSRS